MSELKPGDKIRVKTNPSRVGILTAEVDGPFHRQRVLVNFLDGSDDWLLLATLEKIESTPPGPYRTIKEGRFGRVDDLRGSITYYRLSGKLANLIYSLNTTNTQFLAYQFKPVMNFLDSPCNGILIADEVGLGKTIEAGLIWTELRARLDARRLLIVCPAMLREKWRKELADRFGVQAEIVDARELTTRLKETRGRPFDSFALIASMQGLRPPTHFRDSKSGAARLAQLLEQEEADDPLLDMVVIDEAHYLRNRETQTNKLAQLLRPVTQHLVLLSATPIQLRSTDLFNLLHLLDEDSFPYEHSFKDTLRANQPIIRLRDEVRSRVMTQKEFLDSLETDPLIALLYGESEQVRFLRENPPTDEQLASNRGRAELADQLDRLNPLAKVISRTLKRDVQELRVVRQPKSFKAQMSEPERRFYEQVTEKVRDYCVVNSLSTGFILTIPQRQMSSCMAAACRAWQSRLATSQEEQEELTYDLTGNPELQAEDPPGQLIRELVDIAQSVGSYEVLKAHDTKYAELLRSLRTYWNDQPSRKVVLFSFYRHTLHYLAERLAEDGIKSVVVHGGMDKDAAIDRFRDDAGPNILLSSEVASEGVDLQFSSLLVNYDLPWNPMRIEQRIGRIDRIGQAEDKILIFNLMYGQTVDERVYDRLLERLGIFKRALGSMESILGDEITDLTMDLLSHRLSPEQETARIDQTKVALETATRQQEELERDASQLVAHGEFIQNKVNAARELGRYISGDDLLNYIRDFFRQTFEGTQLCKSDKGDMHYTIELSHEARARLTDFINEHQLQGRTQILAASAPTLLFENRMGKTPPRIERVTQDHPLVRFVTECLRQDDSARSRFPVSAIEVSSLRLKQDIKGTYAYAIQRWLVSGARDIERLEYCLLPLDGGEPLESEDAEFIVNTAAHWGEDWLGAYNEVDTERAADAFSDCKDRLDLAFNAFRSAQQREDNDRRHMMISSIQRHLDNQRNRILEKIQRYRAEGTDKQRRLIPAEEGKIRHLTARLGARIESLRHKEKLQAAHGFVSGGIIRIY